MALVAPHLANFFTPLVRPLPLRDATTWIWGGEIFLYPLRMRFWVHRYACAVPHRDQGPVTGCDQQLLEHVPNRGPNHASPPPFLGYSHEHMSPRVTGRDCHRSTTARLLV